MGKSTVSVNLALALQQVGRRIGLVDADVFGPSIPGMLGLPTGQPLALEATPDKKVIPVDRHGLKAISMGMLRGDDNPAILRGPMVGKYLTFFIGSVQWGQLDYLIIDLPPGTGDTQLTLAQSFPLSGAVVVTTPQDVSLKIARLGLRMFETVHVPILGIIENMSTFTCPHCGKDTDVFRRGGGERMSRQLKVPFLGAIPLDADIVTGGDEGRPIVVDKPNSVAAQAYRAIAAALAGRLEDLPPTALGPFAWTWDTGEGQPAWVESAVQPSGARAGLALFEPSTRAGGEADRDARRPAVRVTADAHDRHHCGRRVGRLAAKLESWSRPGRGVVRRGRRCHRQPGHRRIWYPSKAAAGDLPVARRGRGRRKRAHWSLATSREISWRSQPVSRPAPRSCNR